MSVQNPLTEDALLANRMEFWKSFNSATVIGVVGIVGLLILMWIFLV